MPKASLTRKVNQRTKEITITYCLSFQKSDSVELVALMRSQIKQKMSYNALSFLAREKRRRVINADKIFLIFVDKLFVSTTIFGLDWFANRYFFRSSQQTVMAKSKSLYFKSVTRTHTHICTAMITQYQFVKSFSKSPFKHTYLTDNESYSNAAFEIVKFYVS